MKYELPNIFLHFLNRDTQEIYGVVDDDNDAVSKIQLALNASILLCKDYCILPVGFYFESENAKNIVLDNLDYIREGLLVFAMREHEIQEYIEKKQGQLKNFIDEVNYKRFFASENKEVATIKYATIPRETKIGEYCLLRWVNDIEFFVENLSGDIASIYGVDKKTIDKDTVSIAKAILEKSNKIEEGGAFIWRLMSSELEKFPDRDKRFEYILRMYFEKNYYKAYLEEYQASILYDIFPLENNKDFFLKREFISASNYRWFYEYLKCLEIDSALKCSASQIAQIKRWPEFECLIQLYLEICNSDIFEHSAASIRKETAIRFSTNHKNIKEFSETIKSKLLSSTPPKHIFSVPKTASSSVNAGIYIENATLEVNQEMGIKIGSVTSGRDTNINEGGVQNVSNVDNKIIFQASSGKFEEELSKILLLAEGENKKDIEDAIAATKQKDESRFLKVLKKSASFLGSVASKVVASVLFEYMKQNGILLP